MVQRFKDFQDFYLKFKGSCLKPKTLTPPNRIHFFIVSELDTWSPDLILILL